MIPSSGLAKILCGTSAACIFAVTLVTAATQEPVEIEGGGAPASMQAQLGSSFTDLSQGIQTPDAVDPAEPTSRPLDLQRPDQPGTAQTAQTAAGPAMSEPVEPDRIETEEVATALPTDVPQVAVTPDAPIAAARPPKDRTGPAPAADASGETIVGEEPEPGVVLSSRRPAPRLRDFEREVDRPDPPRQTASATSAPPQGNAEASARAGTQTASRLTGAAQGAAQRRAAQAGNAAVANYPGQVVTRLNRVPRPSVRTTGAARVAFSVSGSGGLSSIAIASSSGSAELDRAAVQIVQRAAPFPPPPPGAQRSFAINISGR